MRYTLVTRRFRYMDYNMESFIQWCDDVTIAEEGVKDAVKKNVDAKAHDLKKFFTPTDLDRADVKKVSSLSGLKNALYRKESVIRVTGSLKEELAKEILKKTAGKHIDTVIKLGLLLTGHVFSALSGAGISMLTSDPAWKNASYYSVVRTKRGAIYLVYGNYYKKKDNDYVHH